MLRFGPGFGLVYQQVLACLCAFLSAFRGAILCTVFLVLLLLSMVPLFGVMFDGTHWSNWRVQVRRRAIWLLSKFRLDGQAKISDQIFVAAPLSVDSRPSDGGAAFKRLGGGGSSSGLLFLDTPISDERAQNQGIRGCSCENQLDRSKQRPVLLSAVDLHDVHNSVDGNCHNGQAEGKEDEELELPAKLHMALDNDGDGKDDEHQVGEDVADGHGDELDIALSALTTRVRQDLPVMSEGVAFGDIANDNGEEGEA